MGNKKKCLFVATVVKTHINEFHLPYLQMFKEAGYEIHVAARNDFSDVGEECYIPNCDRYYDIPFSRSPFSFRNFEAYKMLKKLINEGNYDIIHCHTPVGGIITRFASICARKKGTKIYYTAHGFHFFKGAPLKNWLIYYPIERLAARFTDVLITINHEDYERAQNFHAEKVCFVPGVGIPVERFSNKKASCCEKRIELGVPKDAFVILMVGELSKRKNQETVLKVLFHLKDTNAYVVFCGQGELRHYLEVLSRTLRIEDRVKFLGFRHDVADIYSIADLFLFPSLHEGLPVALMEAMSSGLAVVCSNVRGNHDLIRDGEGGILTATHDVGSIEKAVRKLMNDDLLRQYMGTINRGKVVQYDLDKVKDIMRRIYGL